MLRFSHYPHYRFWMAFHWSSRRYIPAHSLSNASYHSAVFSPLNLRKPSLLIYTYALWSHHLRTHLMSPHRGNQPHCKFFLWVDEHLARIGHSGCVLDKRPLVEKKPEVVEEDEGFHHRIAILEEKVTVLEKKKTPLACCVVIVVCAVVAAFYVCSH
ncbi:hypothetical protein Ahy_B10g105614 [Arachis hypogaea]|uniref:Uncharacterized protein n=1 Tax=Arachis hypogaea TaxID=3818 RepID=A0A444X8T5_ARAHY|nr:hypothetical protein Ahy_B10g105614 [Arachis hypogaea]